MAAIVVVGLGPGARGQVTQEAQELIAAAAGERRLLLRTRIHPTVEEWPELASAPSLDDLYEGGSDFAQVYEQIASAVIEAACRLESAPLVYAVPGHPAVAESTVRRVRHLARLQGIEMHLVPGLSFVDTVLAAVETDAADGLRVADALDLGRIDPTVPLLICQVYARHVASQVKLALGKHYPDDHEVVLVHAAGVPGQERLERCALYELDRNERAAHLTSLWVPPLAPLDAVREPATLREIMARLRAPEPDGCPWDREQTTQTLRKYLLEETYEALEAIDGNDLGALEEELGDLLLQIVFHAQVADEAGVFDLGDVVAGISNKMIRRHPHVFGEEQAADSQAVLRNWEALKRAERAQQAQTERSMLDGVPAAMPALSYAQSVQDRAARVGFDWPDVQGVLEKVAEEARELTEATTDEARREEFGDLLFVLVRLASWLKLDAEDSLRAANRKFRARFAAMERAAHAEGKALNDYDAAGLETLWQAAKASAATPAAAAPETAEAVRK